MRDDEDAVETAGTFEGMIEGRSPSRRERALGDNGRFFVRLNLLGDDAAAAAAVVVEDEEEEEEEEGMGAGPQR